MALVPDQKFSTFQNGGDLEVGDIVVGLRAGLNTKFNYTGELPPGVVVPISNGGTGATTAAQARVNLGLGTMAVQNANAVAITGGTAALTGLQLNTTVILDSNGNSIIGLTAAASAVNYLDIGNAAALSPVFIQALGTDTNISIQYVSKGIGSHDFYSAGTVNQFLFLTGTSYQHASIFNFPATAASRFYTWPDATGTIALTSSIPTGAALTKTDDTNVTLTLGGSPATALVNAASLTLGWTGTLAPSRGGLGTGTAPISGQIPIGNSGGTYTIAAITSGTNILVGNGDGAITIAITGVIAGTNGGTGVNNGANTATFAGNLNFANSFTTSGNFAVTQTYTGVTNVTFPTSGTLATTAQLPTPAALTKTDDTNVTLTLGGTPSTALLQATSLTLGWTGTLSGTRGGTGVNNGASTFTMGGNVAFSGGFTFTGTLTGNTAVTFPTSGTLATTAQLVTPAALTKTDDTNVTLTLGGSPSTALVNAASLTLGWTGQLAITRGGTGISAFGTGVQTALGQNVTGSGGIVLATSPTLVTPVLGVASATSLTFTSTSGIIGTTTNDSAAAGSVGQYVSSNVPLSPGTNIPSNTATNLTSISLTAGDWDVEGNITYNGSSAISIIAWANIINTASATLPGDGSNYVLNTGVSTTFAGGTCITTRVSVASTTTVYLIGYVTLSGVTTCVMGGNLTARRRR